MKHPLFKETAEEMVNRLFDEIPTKNYLPKNFLSPIPELKSTLIKCLKRLDNDTKKEFEKQYPIIKGGPDPDLTELENKLDKDYWEEYFKNQREQFILHNIIKAMYYNPPNTTGKQNSPHTHYKESQKPSHLRLVVNNG